MKSISFSQSLVSSAITGRNALTRAKDGCATAAGPAPKSMRAAVELGAIKYRVIPRLFSVIVPACLALAGCGGGGSGTDATAAGAYTKAASASFSPTTAKAASGQNVALHWVYAVNGGQAISASVGAVTVGVSVASAEVKLDPTDLKRTVTMSGNATANSGGVAYTGSFSATIAEELSQASGKTLISGSSARVNVTLSGGGDSGAGDLTATLAGITPAVEWLPDRETLDQLANGFVTTAASSGTLNASITVTGESPITLANQRVSLNERWTVLEKSASMTVQGKTYTNIVKLSRQTSAPDFSGRLAPVTILYWVAKGVGMIKGQGVYRVLNNDAVVYELVDTNVGPSL